VGLLVSFEGIDGSGKSTQARRLAEALRAAGHEAVLTREPGGSEGAEEIRRLVLTGATGRWSPVTEALLFTAARRDHLERLVEPALARGAWVVTDRFADSTRVYQGATRGDLGEMVDRLHDLAVGREPDRTFLIDMDPRTALARSLDRLGVAPDAEDRFESFGLAFQDRLRAGFLALARRWPGRIAVIDGDRAPEAVAADVAGRLGL
jgi:dTMP kinase